MGRVATSHKKWDSEARKILLGWTCFMTGGYVWDLVGDYFIDGPQKITAQRVVIRAMVAAAFWLAGVLVLRWLVRLVDKDSGGARDSEV